MALSVSEIAAWWGASVATIVLVWDVFKWISNGPKLSMLLSPNMQVLGDPSREGKTWVSITISNTGSRPTTLKGVGIEFYDSFAQRLLGKPSHAALFPNPNDNLPLPRVIQPGDEWTGLIPQERVDKDLSLQKMAHEGHLMVWASQSHSKRSKRLRLVIERGGNNEP
ncbi:hypothetical protein [Salinivibrio kushneri]|uniref:hypothetical protein n=1 Tax=Salinivibrio kushneri TaxID=1908198 RepID=UPI00098989D9|nr:hypothetical protein [Salinivibrio kushneri]OOE63468.1 hypothetical protein BZG19_16215 [Salinivibrio kushneri]